MESKRTGVGNHPGTRTRIPALPFCEWKLTAPKPRVFPKGYPFQPRSLGELIRKRRMDLGLTQERLAELLGRSTRSVIEWENDESVPLARGWPKLEALLGPGLVPVDGGLPGRLRAARLGLGLTQEELATRAGLHARTIRNAEQGRFRPDRRTSARLASVFGQALDPVTESDDDRALDSRAQRVEDPG